MKNILLTGSKGQLGSELIKIVNNLKNSINLISTDYDTLDICDEKAVNSFFNTNKIDYCINAAAYTQVDLAESEREKASKINALGPEILAQACNKHEAKFIHISTDFVFDGSQNNPYKESDAVNPISIYGKTKYEGEQNVVNANPEACIIRTSWLYSGFGNNFVKTMLRLASDKDQLGIVADQIGSPTYAADLAKDILHIIQQDFKNISGIYHYSNEGVASWFDFASAIFEMKNIKIKVNPIKTTEYPTPAKRPPYSVMDKTKFKSTFNTDIRHWKEALKDLLSQD